MQPNELPPVVTEQTSKRWKRLTLVGVALFAASLPTCCISVAAGPDDGGAALMLAACLMFGGLGVGAYARFGRWWHHG